jgi:predicted DNA-binding transcriptional regulator YafY
MRTRHLELLIGRTAEMIYMDGKGRLTGRRIVVKAVKDGYIQAYCLDRRAPRVFRISRILACAAAKGSRPERRPAGSALPPGPPILS